MTRELYDPETRKPTLHGTLDRRMGTSDKQAICDTCGMKLAECSGHFGHTRLALPVFHIGFFKAALQVLQDICKNCARVLLSNEERIAFLRRLRAPRIDSLQKASVVKAIHERCKKISLCPFCRATNGIVRKVGALKIIHEKFRAGANPRKTSIPGGGLDTFRSQFQKAIEANSELKPHVAKAAEDLNPLRALELFDELTSEDCELLGLDIDTGHPRNFLWTSLPVPPACIRPSVGVGSEGGGSGGGAGTNEDDLTMKMAEIVYCNALLLDSLERGNMPQKIYEEWDNLQLQCAVYINSELPGVSSLLPMGTRPIRGLCQRLKGKTGRFRGNLSGKRVDFSSRTVISPDPNLEIDQIAVPVHVAKILTYPEPVTSFNLARLRDAVANGPDVHPGANYVQHGSSLQTASTAGPAAPFKRFLRFGDRRKIARELRIGDIVERHMRDGDIVLFNRQPSLHKLSIMSHRAVIRPWRTFRFNECACTPYNADFDGDEMNLHLPQTEEARTEALHLMGVRHNLVTPRNGQPLVAAIQDFITASHLLTQRDVFLGRDAFCQLIAMMSDANRHVVIPVPAVLRPAKLWTGKQLITVLLHLAVLEKSQYYGKNYLGKLDDDNSIVDSKDDTKKRRRGTTAKPKASSKNAKNSNKDDKDHPPNIGLVQGVPLSADDKENLLCKLNLETRTRTFAGKKDLELLCPKDGYLVLHEGQLLLGTLDKSIVGGESKGSSILYLVMRECGVDAAVRCMSFLAKLCARWLGTRGFSIGVSDVQAGTHLQLLKQRVVAAGYAECDASIEAYAQGRLQSQPGCSIAETLEAVISGTLSRIRDDVGQACLNELGRHNAPLVMQWCGSKGSKINVSQMVACVGQQIISGSRIPDGFDSRSLPHFPKHSRAPAAKGFVSASFYSGLSPPEFFFHAVSGREGLVDTAVKTAETGYMQRRLMKALEDLSMQYDLSVRNSVGGIVQLLYGDDGLDPASMEAPDGCGPVNFARVLLQSTYSSFELVTQNDRIDNSKAALDDVLTPDLALKLTEERLSNAEYIEGCSENFRNAILEFVRINVVGRLERLNRMYSIDMKSNELMSLEACEETVDRIKINLMMRQMGALDRRQLNIFLDTCLLKYTRARIEPGTAVGALGAQSIGEPGTQMTLKTFHFAGVASMNVTLGVPRIKEIINASKQISTPIITARLDSSVETSVQAARVVKGRIERTLLGDVCSTIEEVYDQDDAYLAVTLDLEAIRSLQLDVDVHSVVSAIARTPRLKIGPAQVISNNTVRIRPHLSMLNQKVAIGVCKTSASMNTDQTYYAMQKLKRSLPTVPVCGVAAVKRAVINDVRGDASRFNLLVEGYGLLAVMGTSGVLGRETTSNHVMEVQTVLGIEAARQTIANEVQYTMAKHGMTIDNRHVTLLADVMTCKGEVLGITRFGIAKMKDSVLMLASFEKTTDHLFDAARLSKKDTIDGVSECIIMGMPMPIGTGLFKLVQKASRPAVLPARRLLFETLVK